MQKIPKPRIVRGHCEWKTRYFRIVFSEGGTGTPFEMFPKRFQEMFVKQALAVEEFFGETFLLQYDLASKVRQITLIVTAVGKEGKARYNMKGIAHVIYPERQTYSPLLGKKIGKNTPIILWTPEALKLTNPYEVQHVARHEIIHAFLNSFIFSSLGHANSRHKREFVENLVDFAALFSAKGTNLIVKRLMKEQT